MRIFAPPARPSRTRSCSALTLLAPRCRTEPPSTARRTVRQARRGAPQQVGGDQQAPARRQVLHPEEVGNEHGQERDQEPAEEAESAMQGMMEYKGR